MAAGELSEMARELEIAGKENRIDYIVSHHDAMMESHDRLLAALDGNVYVYPDRKVPALRKRKTYLPPQRKVHPL